MKWITLFFYRATICCSVNIRATTAGEHATQAFVNALSCLFNKFVYDLVTWYILLQYFEYTGFIQSDPGTAKQRGL